MKTIVGIGIAVVGVIALYFLIKMGYSNNEIDLRNQYIAQLKVNEASFDKTWKIIQQQAGVADEERKSFRKTYVEIMNATKGVAGTGMLASFFTQAQINVAPELFSKLMTAIEAQRESFFRDQSKLVQIHKQHSDALTQEPSRWFVGGREPITLIIVTSGVTDKAFTSGQENDIDLFDSE